MKNLVLVLALASVNALGAGGDRGDSGPSSSTQSPRSATSQMPVEAWIIAKTFSHTEHHGPMLGRPAGAHTHYLKFLRGNKVLDNAPTFFGKAVATHFYAFKGSTIEIKEADGDIQVFTLSVDRRTVTDKSSGEVLTLADDVKGERLVRISDQSEITKVTRVLHLAQVPTRVEPGPDCRSLEAIVENFIRGSKSGEWSVTYGSTKKPIDKTEVQHMVNLFTRLHVAPMEENGIDVVQRVRFRMDNCGFDSETWVASYERAK